jgi:branched-chain amino acid transport system ATP-binding protein
MTAVLSTRGLSVRYGGVKALSAVDLDVEAGQLVGLIGPNGAGKTTLIDAVTGFTACQGEILLSERPINRLSPDARARAGLARTWQSTDLFDDLTVRENLAVTCQRPPILRILKELVRGDTMTTPGVNRALQALELEELADMRPRALSEAHRRLVGVARALAAEPQALCLDEPAAGLDAGARVALGQHLKEIAARGIAVLLVDHDMGLVLTVCDHVVVLDFGSVIARGSPEDVRADAKVIEAYLGSVDHDVTPIRNERR